MNASTGRRQYSLIRETDSTWAASDTTKLKHGGIKHAAHLSAPQTFFSWLTIDPSISINEAWIFNYKVQAQGWDENVT